MALNLSVEAAKKRPLIVRSGLFNEDVAGNELTLRSLRRALSLRPRSSSAPRLLPRSV